MANLINMQLNYNGIEFCAQVDQETHDAILNDEDLLCQYSKQVYEAYFENDDVTMNAGPSADETNQIHSVFKWTERLTRLLIRTRLDMEQKFISPICKKTKYWQEIARKISSITNLNITADACNTKYRNLLATYKKNKRKQGSTGEGAICWEYFNLFDEVLGNKVSSGIPPESLLGTSLLNGETGGETADNNVTEELEESNEAVASTSRTLNLTRKRKLPDKSRHSGLSLQMYLREKLQKEENKEKERKEQEAKKIEREERKWQQKMELKEREINAILALAQAISDKK